jgi:hypothetical protein
MFQGTVHGARRKVHGGSQKKDTAAVAAGFRRRFSKLWRDKRWRAEGDRIGKGVMEPWNSGIEQLIDDVTHRKKRKNRSNRPVKSASALTAVNLTG